MKKKLLIIILITLLCPLLVLAGSTSDDSSLAFSAPDLDANYTYGKIKECVDTYYAKKGIYTINGYDFCVYKDGNYQGYATPSKFSCADSNMERFLVENISGSDGNKYFAYGCRKIKDLNNIEYTKKTLYVGEGEQVPGANCTILSGDSVKFNNHNSCWVDAVKAGTSRVKSSNNTYANFYFEYTVLNRYKKISELDNKYNYGSVDDCSLGSGNGGSKVNFDGLTFCGSGHAGYGYQKTKVTCVDEGYSIFQIAFTSGAAHYKGYGCRKEKSTEVIEFIEKTIYAGLGEQIPASENTHKCEIMYPEDKTYGDFAKNNACYFEAKSVGTVRIKTTHKTNSDIKYYKYKVIEAPNTITTLDTDKYLYGNIKDCVSKMGVADKVTFENMVFCVSSLPGYDSVDITRKSCEQEGYELFQVTFQLDGKIYRGFGCRFDKTKVDPDQLIELPNIPNIDPVTDCKSLLGNPTDKPAGDIPGSPAYYLTLVLKIMRYLAIIILITFTTVEFTKSIASKDDESIKKAMNSAIKRLVICVIIFFIPTLIELILKYVHTVATDTCGIK